MRIAFYAPRAAYVDPSRSGGDAIFVLNLLAALRERGHDVEILSQVDIRDFWRGRLPARRLLTEGIAIRTAVRRFSPDAWLLYSPSVTYPDLFGWWQQPKPYVLFAAHTGRGERLPRRWRWLFAFAHRRSLARADAVIVHRPEGAAKLRSVGVAPERIRVMPSPPRRWEHMPSREEARQRLGLPQDTPVILAMCRFPRPKESRRAGKTEMALDLLAALTPLPREVLLVLVGDDGAGRQQVEAEIARLGLERRVRLIRPEERVRLLGSMDNEEVKWFYAACDLYAYPHPLDRPWLSVLEAQTCGRPVVTMRTPSTELIVEDGRTGLLAKDLDEFQAHLAALACDPARCESMGQSAGAYVAKFHSMALCVRQIEELLLGGR